MTDRQIRRAPRLQALAALSRQATDTTLGVPRFRSASIGSGLDAPADGAGQGEGAAALLPLLSRLGSPVKILIAIDTVRLAKQWAEALAGEPVIVRRAVDRADALTELRADVVSIVVSDDIGLLVPLRADAGGRSTYFLLVCEEGVAPTALQAGVDDVISSRCDPSLLRARLRAACRTLAQENAIRTAFAGRRSTMVLDPLTGFLDPESFGRLLSLEASKAAARSDALSVVVFRVDGEPVGGTLPAGRVTQEVIGGIAQVLRSRLRHGLDWAARADERTIATVLPGCDRIRARRLAIEWYGRIGQVIRRLVEEPGSMRVSAGVVSARLPPADVHGASERMWNLAERALERGGRSLGRRLAVVQLRRGGL